MRARRAVFGSLLLVALSLLSSCASYVESRAGSVLLDAMPRVIGPADRYEATVRGANASASHFDAVHAVGVRVQRPGVPVIDRFVVDLKDVELDRPNKQITAIGAAQAAVRITAADLSTYLVTQRWIEQPVVSLMPPDIVAVSGVLRVPGLPIVAATQATFRGRLVASGPKLRVAIDALSAGGRSAPPLALVLIETAINPLLDLAAYAVASTIDRVRVESDAIDLVASGTRMTLSPR